MSSVTRYENYTQPFRGFGQTTTESSWFKRNWAFLMQVIGLAFVTGGMVARQYVDRQVPVSEKIGADDWDMMINAVQRIYPRMPRAEIERKLCELFGDRAPFCANIMPVIKPQIKPVSAELPSWVWLAAIGVGAVILLK